MYSFKFLIVNLKRFYYFLWYYNTKLKNQTYKLIKNTTYKIYLGITDGLNLISLRQLKIKNIKMSRQKRSRKE